jgi:protein gp37
MENSKIQWTHHTHNPWLGCRKVADECDNCYIVHQTPLRVRNIVHGSDRHRCSESTLRQPLSWNRKAEKAGERHRVFCLSLGDWADGEVPNEWRDDLFDMIGVTKNLDWLLLTKRPMLARKYLQSRELPENVWLGVSAGVDPTPIFDVPAKIHFLSCEPMLRPLDETHAAKFKWIIFGGESDPRGNARECRTDWIRDGLRFCNRHGIAPYVKQLGANAMEYSMKGSENDGWYRLPLRDSHGGDWGEWPENLKVREFPVLATGADSLVSVTHWQFLYYCRFP